MSTIAEYLRLLASSGITLHLGEHELLVRSERGIVDSPLKSEIENRLSEIVHFLSGVETKDPRNSYAEVALDDPMAVSSVQRRLWFLRQQHDNSSAEHVPMTWHGTGALNIAALRAAVDHLVARHEVLRTNVYLHSDQLYMRRADCSRWLVETLDLLGATPESPNLSAERVSSSRAASTFMTTHSYALRYFSIRPIVSH